MPATSTAAAAAIAVIHNLDFARLAGIKYNVDIGLKASTKKRHGCNCLLHGKLKCTEVWPFLLALLCIANAILFWPLAPSCSSSSSSMMVQLLLLLLALDEPAEKMFCLVGLVCLGSIPLWGLLVVFFLVVALLPLPAALGLVLTGVLELKMSLQCLSPHCQYLGCSWTADYQVVVCVHHHYCCCCYYQTCKISGSIKTRNTE